MYVNVCIVCKIYTHQKYMYTHTRAPTHLRIHVLVQKCTMHAYTCAKAHTRTNTYTHVRAHMHTHTHTQPHKQTHNPPLSLITYAHTNSQAYYRHVQLRGNHSPLLLMALQYRTYSCRTAPSYIRAAAGLFECSLRVFVRNCNACDCSCD